MPNPLESHSWEELVRRVEEGSDSPGQKAEVLLGAKTTIALQSEVTVLHRQIAYTGQAIISKISSSTDKLSSSIDQLGNEIKKYSASNDKYASAMKWLTGALVFIGVSQVFVSAAQAIVSWTSG